MDYEDKIEQQISADVKSTMNYLHRALFIGGFMVAVIIGLAVYSDHAQARHPINGRVESIEFSDQPTAISPDGLYTVDLVGNNDERVIAQCIPSLCRELRVGDTIVIDFANSGDPYVKSITITNRP